MRRPRPSVLLLAGGLLAATALASCGTSGGEPVPIPMGGLCRIGPNGGPLLAERGIGGTGGVVPGSAGGPVTVSPGEGVGGSITPAPRPGDRGIGGTGGVGAIAGSGSTLLAERGIGGTGSVGTGPVDGPGGGIAPPPRPGDRGIGGTGVVGVITGFGSVCVDGLEVALAPDTAVAVDDMPATAAALRAGQLVVLRAADATAAPRTAGLLVRHEVVGTAHDAGEGMLEVAGQRVLVGPQTQGVAHPAPGAVVAVSGLRDASGAVVATRMDVRRAAAPDTAAPTLVRGTLTRDGAVLHLGALLVSPALGLVVPGDGPVTATGTLDGGTLRAATLVPDLLATDPAAYFGPGVDRYVLESYVDPRTGRLLLGQALHGDAAAQEGRSIMAFERGGAVTALISVRSAAAAAAALGVPGHPMGDAGMFAAAPGGPGGSAGRPVPAGSAAEGRQAGEAFAPAPVPRSDSGFGLGGFGRSPGALPFGSLRPGSPASGVGGSFGGSGGGPSGGGPGGAGGHR